MVGTHPHLMRRRVAMVARGVCETVPNRPFTTFIENWSNAPITLHKNMLVAQCTPASETFWPKYYERDGIDMTKLCKKAESKKEKLERHYAVAQEDAAWSEKRWTEQVQFNKRYSEWRLAFMKVMEKYQSMWEGHFGQISVAEPRINLGPPDAAPIYAATYRSRPRQRNLENKEVDQMFEAGVAEPETTEWASSIVSVPKKDGCFRVYVDYRRLNAVTIQYSYPIPRMDECIDSLGEAQVFSALDANYRY